MEGREERRQGRQAKKKQAEKTQFGTSKPDQIIQGYHTGVNQNAKQNLTKIKINAKQELKLALNKKPTEEN